MNSVVWFGLTALQLLVRDVTADDWEHEKVATSEMSHDTYNLKDDRNSWDGHDDRYDWSRSIASAGVSSVCNIYLVMILAGVMIMIGRFALR